MGKNEKILSTKNFIQVLIRLVRIVHTIFHAHMFLTLLFLNKYHGSALKGNECQKIIFSVFILV